MAPLDRHMSQEDVVWLVLLGTEHDQNSLYKLQIKQIQLLRIKKKKNILVVIAVFLGTFVLEGFKPIL